MTRLSVVLSGLLCVHPALAHIYLEPPRYVVAAWDGEATAPGLWFTIDGEVPSADKRLSIVTRLPEGVTIAAEAVDLEVSAALAAHLGLQRDRPALFEIGRVAALPAESAADDPAASVADEFADRHARVTELLEALRSAAADTVAAGYRATPPTPPPAPPVEAAATAGAGGLVSSDPRAWP